jgi:hypothetical protein
MKSFFDIKILKFWSFGERKFNSNYIVYNMDNINLDDEMEQDRKFIGKYIKDEGQHKKLEIAIDTIFGLFPNVKEYLNKTSKEFREGTSIKDIMNLSRDYSKKMRLNLPQTIEKYNSLSDPEKRKIKEIANQLINNASLFFRIYNNDFGIILDNSNKEKKNVQSTKLSEGQALLDKMNKDLEESERRQKEREEEDSEINKYNVILCEIEKQEKELEEKNAQLAQGVFNSGAQTRANELKISIPNLEEQLNEAKEIHKGEISFPESCQKKASGGGRKRKSRKRRKRKTKRRRRRGGVKTKKSPTKKSPTKSPKKSKRKSTPKRKRHPAYIVKNKPPKRTPNNVSLTVQELEPIKEDTDEKAFRRLFQTSGTETTKPDKLLRSRPISRKSLPPHYWTRDGHNNPIKYLKTRKGGRKRRRRRTKKRRKRRR